MLEVASLQSLEPGGTETAVDTKSLDGFAPRDPRKVTKWIGRVRLKNGSEFPCIVKDASKSGLKISIPSSFSLSKTLLLVIDERNIEMIVNIVWRQGNFVGVKIERLGRIKGRPKWAPSLDE